ncbi:MAG: S41 family peptidase [Crocinitomicaceae bacterium]|nr:S41 family peptidase [Crocinitomicaceae bacterium]
MAEIAASYLQCLTVKPMNNERLDKYQSAPEEPNTVSRVKGPSPFQPLFFAATLIVGLLIGTFLADRNILQIKTGVEGNPNKLVSLIDFIEDNYVDTVGKRKLIDDAIESILRNLDPHSYYISPEEFASATEQLEGGFDGIGIEFLILRDTLMVVKTVAGGPSELAGLKAGDRIVKVNGEDISGKELSGDKAQKLLKGKKGSDVQVTVVRKGEDEPLAFTVTRGVIPIESVPAAFMVADSIGYVKVERFAKTTYHEFFDATEGLRKKGCNKLILDLRGNGGGLMDEATKMVEEFLTEGKIIVYTEGAHSGKEVTRSSKKGSFRDMEVVVLIDQGSASASEIVAGALQDWDRSVTVGRRSFGKGLVQREFDLPDNSALRLTVARYYTPTGRCIQKPYGDSIDYSDDFHQRLIKGELTSADSISGIDSLKKVTPGGRIVYGGGGITPDVFVPIDSVYLSSVLGEIAFSGAIRNYCFNYVDQHRKELARFNKPEEFIERFTVSESMIADMIKELGGKKTDLKQKAISMISGELKNRIKAQIARNLFDENSMYRVLLKNDQDFKKALSVARNYERFALLPVIKK